MGIDLNPIEKDKSANFIVINPDVTWTFDYKDISSMSQNSCLIGESMKAKIDLVACKNKIHTI